MSPFTIVCTEEPAVVQRRLAAALTTERPEFFPAECKFRGVVSDHGFWIIRNQHWIESWWPILATGRFEKTDNGTLLRVNTRPTGLRVAFLILWSVFFLFLVMRELWLASSAGAQFACLITFFVGIMFVMWAAALVIWTREVQKCNEWLTRVLTGHYP